MRFHSTRCVAKSTTLLSPSLGNGRFRQTDVDCRVHHVNNSRTDFIEKSSLKVNAICGHSRCLPDAAGKNVSSSVLNEITWSHWVKNRFA